MYSYSYGNNSQNALYSFENRKEYDEKIVPLTVNEVYNNSKENYIDLFINKPFYGRINHFSNSCFAGEVRNSEISPAEYGKLLPFITDKNKFLKKFENSDQYAMNFVVDSFQEMIDYYNRNCQIINSLSKTGVLANLRPVVGYIDPVIEYFYFLSSVNRSIDKFCTFNDNNKFKTITNFTDYCNIAISFFIKNREDFSILFSNFIMSRYCPPNASGLVVQIASENSGDDFLKSYTYMSNKNYNFFVECAQRFGFFIDRNCPWRLVANFSSDNMLPYMSRYKLQDYKDTFKKQFLETYEYDIYMLKYALINLYLEFLTLYPTYIKKTQINECYIKEEELRRPLISAEEIYTKYKEEYFLEYYIKLRLASSREKMDENRLTRLINQCNEIYRAKKNLKNVLFFLNNYFNGYKNQISNKNYFTPK